MNLPKETGKFCAEEVGDLGRDIFGAKLSFASGNFKRAMKYSFKIVTLPRLIELGDADNFPSLERTWLGANNLLRISSNQENKCW